VINGIGLPQRLLLLGFIMLSSVTFGAQKTITRVELMPNIPSPFQIKDWKKTAQEFDAFVFDFNTSGQYLPIIWWDTSGFNFDRDMFALPPYVGSPFAGGISHEALGNISAVVGASLAGIDKSNQNGQNFVLQCENYFNIDTGENLFLDFTLGDTGQTFWFELFPSVLMFQLNDLYPNTGNIENELIITANKWYDACVVMGGQANPWTVPDFWHTAFDFDTMSPVDNGIWLEPDAAAAIAWIEYMAWVQWGNTTHLNAAKWGVEFLEAQTTNPLYEALMPLGPYVAARMNAEQGTTYDVQKILNFCFNVSGHRVGWGVVADTWGAYDAHGLVGDVGPATPFGGYAFFMETAFMFGDLIPVVRYDDSFARAIGKWALNAANNCRMFYRDVWPDDQQSSEFWTGDPNGVIAYEALKRSFNGKSPYAMGDPLLYGWANTDFGVYGSSFVGYMGGIISTTNEEKILQLDCLKTDFYHDDAYPTYLYYNPHTTAKAVNIDVGVSAKDLYDAVSNTFLQTNVSGSTLFSVPADSAVVLVVAPAGGVRTVDGLKLLIDGVIVDYSYEESGPCNPPLQECDIFVYPTLTGAWGAWDYSASNFDPRPDEVGSQYDFDAVSPPGPPGQDKAEWSPGVDGNYEILVSWSVNPGHATNALYVVSGYSGIERDMTKDSNGNSADISSWSGWSSLGRFDLTSLSTITLDRNGADAPIIAEPVLLKSYLGDLDCDGDVDSIDLELFAGCWLCSDGTCSVSDFNDDDKVNLIDLSFFSSHWLAN